MGECLADVIKGVCDEFNVFKKAWTMTGDNGANMKDAAKVLGLTYISCFEHVLNRVIVTALKNLKFCSESGSGEALIEKCRKLVGTFSHSIQRCVIVLKKSRLRLRLTFTIKIKNFD